MNRDSDLRGVRESGMCIACGACVHADPSVELVFDDKYQMYSPSSDGSNLAATVCPAVKIDYTELMKELFPGEAISEHGVIKEVFLAQSNDNQRNLLASSGGIIKELMRDFLLSGEVSGIISLSHTEGLNYKPTIIRNVDQVDSLPGSIYHNLPFDETLRLLQEEDGRFILVGIPCQIEGINLYIRNCAPELREKIHTTIGLICGWNYSHHALRAICSYKGIDFNKIEKISYRGGGPVGKLRILADGEEHNIHRRVDFSYQAAFDRSYNIPRCHVCVNHTNYLADIVVGDAWLPSTVGTKTGVSIVICRTESAMQQMNKLAEKGLIRLTRTSTDDITESQSRSITFGDFSYPYGEFLRQLPNTHCPDLKGPNHQSSRPVSIEKVKTFHDEFVLKTSLQQRRQYGKLWWRKLTIEFGKLSAKYINWFFVRFLKIKSLFGLRKESEKPVTSIFR